MAHPQKDNKTRPTYFEVCQTNESYGREISRLIHYPVLDQDFFAMERPIDSLCDQRTAWPSYDHVIPHAALPHREYWSKYSQPIAYHPHAPYPSLRSSAEASYVASPTQGKSWRKHKDDAAHAHSIESEVWNATPEKRKLAKSEHRMVLRGAYSDPGVGVSTSARGRTRRISSNGGPIFPSIKEADDEGRHQISHVDKPHFSVPPRAPKIPRLPTPDFSDDEESHSFCSCCNADGGHETGCEQEEDSQIKMERQLRDAKVYMARKKAHAH
ncbi:uncharacterized protein GGS22DRAFT_191510 [Annulohypoxylon maeteangense]|uniref:uncharacterized protein n=1 Tax=Annulohypoxylon maeteangense TaxID=1927788 RepID=UPI0020079858|nr:uncharacterized protein GGS22DRAFT_191510 [Annulohypoxylon maeteangense]KAI0882339.1 hypothetical protein GGS22DRAFT_191510 [Annulohypoxylon maeteangense]